MDEDNLKDHYKFVYKCSCGKEYGNDKKENGKHICPLCEGRLK